MYTYPCDSDPVISLAFQGINLAYPIASSDLNLGSITGTGSGVCMGAILGADNKDSNGDTFAIVGDAFLKSFYR